MRQRLSCLLLAAALSAAPLAAQPYLHRIPPPNAASAEHQALLAAYDRAIYDSSVYRAENLRPLRPLQPDEHGEVVVATLTSHDGTVGELLTIGGQGTWVTGFPEVQTICRKWTTGDVEMRLRQLIGLPPDAHIPRVLTFRAAAADLFRPALDPDITAPYPCEQLHEAPRPADCGNTFPAGTTTGHFAWIAEAAFSLHELPGGYPWTHLGYTYNWARGEDRYGASEYIIRPGAVVLIVGNTTPAEYCKPVEK